MHPIKFAALLVLLSFSAGVLAEIQPDTQPAGDSPKAALKAQDAAARSGDVDADMQFYLADGAQQKKLARAIASADVAVAALEKAVAQRFDQDLAEESVRAAGMVDGSTLDKATEHVDSDHATIQFGNAFPPVPMVRADGKWKVSIGQWTQGASSSDLDRLTSSLDELSTQINHVTDLVAHDKFRSGQGVRDRIRELHDRVLGKG